jgi:hypothetical protein
LCHAFGFWVEFPTWMRKWTDIGSRWQPQPHLLNCCFSVPTLIFESDVWFHSWFDNHDVQMATATLNQVRLVQPLLPIIFDTLTLIQNLLDTPADCALEIIVHSTFWYIPGPQLTWFRAQSLNYSCCASGWTAGVFLCRSLVVWEETRFKGCP